MEKLNYPTRYQVRTVMDKTGWSHYETYARMMKLCENPDVTYAKIIKENLWRDFKVDRAADLKAMVDGTYVEKEIQLDLDRDEIDRIFYTPSQLDAIESIKNGVITFKTLADYLRVDFPEELMQKEDNLYDKIAFAPNALKYGGVYFCTVGGYVRPDVAAVKKPICIIGYPKYEKRFEGLDIPFIPRKNLGSFMIDIAEFWRSRNDLKVVGITGSVGKTSTTEMIGKVAAAGKKSFKIEGNQNTTWQVAKFIYDVPSDAEVFVQECSGASIGQLEKSSRAIRPNIFVVTNVGNGHIGKFDGKQEFLLHEKVAFDRQSAPNAVGIINWDDKNLRSIQYKNRIVRIAVKAEDVDYHSINISEQDDMVSFDVLERDGRTTPVVINACGLHNVQNALSAFAVGVELGIDREIIVEALASYRPEGVRQNLVWLAGQHLYMDCYSATEDSMRTATVAIDTINVPEGGRKILMVGDIPDLGDQDEEIHRRIGKMIAEVNSPNIAVFYGEKMGYAMEEAQKASSIKCYHFTKREEVEDFIREKTTKLDLISFKASHKCEFQRIIDDVFGTDFYLQDEQTKKAPIVNLDGNSFKCVEDYGCGLIKANKAVKTVTIPQAIDGNPVRIIDRGVFASSGVVEVTMQESVDCIAQGAFFNCKNLETVNMPHSLKYIGNNAFKKCSGLKKVIIPEGAKTIGRDAFVECENLKKVYVPDSVQTIGNGAFGKNTAVVCKPGSYAYKWAKKNNQKRKITFKKF